MLFGCTDTDEPDETNTLKQYKLRIYFADNELETGKPISLDIIKLFYAIEVDTVVFSANDAVGKKSPLLIRLDTKYEESMAVEFGTTIGSNPAPYLIKKYIDDKFARTNPYVVTKKLGDNYRTINQSEIDTLLGKFSKKQGVFIYSGSEISEYKGFKVIDNIDSLRYAIGQKLLENSSQEINVLYGLTLQETPTEPESAVDEPPKKEPIVETPPQPEKTPPTKPDTPPHKNLPKKQPVEPGRKNPAKISKKTDDKSELDVAKGLPSIKVKEGDFDSRNNNSKKN